MARRPHIRADHSGHHQRLVPGWVPDADPPRRFGGGIPEEYYQAASIDGAGWWSKLFHVTLPMLAPTTFFVLLTSAMGAITGMQAFDLVFILTSGGPADATLTMPFYIYEQAFTYNDLGYASTLTVLLVAVLVVAVALTFRMTKGAKFHAD